MTTTNQRQLETIRSSKQAAPCVSIYLNKPNARLSEEVASIALYRQLVYARRLLETSQTPEQASNYLRPLWLVAQDELLNEGSGSIALFHSGEISTRVRLPERVPEQTVVADAFHIKPFAKAGFIRTSEQLENDIRGCRQALTRGDAITGLFEVAQALKSGRLRQLWIAEDVTLWGMLNRRLGSVVLHPQQLNARDGDILDDFCEWAIDQGCDLVILPKHQIPGQYQLIGTSNESNTHERRNNETHHQ